MLLRPRTGSHEFTFVIRTDSGSGAGVGVIAEGASTELPSCWPNSGVADLWWLTLTLTLTLTLALALTRTRTRTLTLALALTVAVTVT